MTWQTTSVFEKLKLPALLLLIAVVFAGLLQGLYAFLDLNEFRDNARYLVVYEEIRDVGLEKAYDVMRSRHPGPKASEPLFFALFFAGSQTISWGFWILIKNIAVLSVFLAMVLQAGSERRDDRTTMGFLLLLCASDFYLIQMGVVIHKLSVAIGVFSAGYVVARGKVTVPTVVLSSLTHFQMILMFALLPLDRVWQEKRKRTRYIVLGALGIVGFAAVMAAVPFLRDGLSTKIRFYAAQSGGLQLNDLRVLVLAIVYSVIFWKLHRPALTPYLLLGAVVVAGIVVGYERILFLIYWGCVFGIATSSVGFGRRLLLVSPFVVYNLYRLIVLFSGS